jgi:hypothetical protein
LRALARAPPKPAGPITPVSVFNAAIALRNSTQNTNYSGALGGPCANFDPPFSYWCSEHPAGGGGFQYYVPGGATLAADAVPAFTIADAANPPVFQVRSGPSRALRRATIPITHPPNSTRPHAPTRAGVARRPLGQLDV